VAMAAMALVLTRFSQFAPIARADAAVADIIFMRQTRAADLQSGSYQIMKLSPGTASGTVSTLRTTNWSNGEDPQEGAPVVSPNGSQIAFETEESHLMVMSANGSGATELVSASCPITRITWAPVGQQIVYASCDKIYRASLGDSSPTLLTDVVPNSTSHPCYPWGNNPNYLGTIACAPDPHEPSWSPFGDKIVYSAIYESAPGEPVGRQLFIMNADGTGKRLLASSANSYDDITPTWSPDASRIYFGSSEGEGIWYYSSNDGFTSTSVTRDHLTDGDDNVNGAGVYNHDGSATQSTGIQVSSDGSTLAYAEPSPFSSVLESGIYTVSSTGGTPSKVLSDTSSSSEGVSHSSPSFVSLASAEKNLLALGDSVAAGEGINDGYIWTGSSWAKVGPAEPVWADTTDALGSDHQTCHQSDLAYSRLFRGDGYDVRHMACTGATAFNLDGGVLTDQVFVSGEETIDTVPAQLGGDCTDCASPNTDLDFSDTDVITLTIGANDIEFHKWLAKCYVTDTWPILITTVACGTTADNNEIATQLSEAKGDLHKVLNELDRRASEKHKRPIVLVTNYYMPLPDTFQSGCVDIQSDDFGTSGLGLTEGEFNWIKSKFGTLNTNIADEVRDAIDNHDSLDVRLVDISRIMQNGYDGHDHSFCSAYGPWVHGPSIAYDDYDFFAPTKAPYHPTIGGQRAIYRAIKNTLTNALNPVSVPGGTFSAGGVLGTVTLQTTNQQGLLIQGPGLSTGDAGGGLQLVGGGWDDDPSHAGMWTGAITDLGTYHARSATATGIGMQDGNIYLQGKSGLTDGDQFNPNTILTVGTADTNLITNPSLEGPLTTGSVTNWTDYTCESCTALNTANHWNGNSSLAVTATEEDDGAKNNLGAALDTETDYTLSFYAKSSSGTATVEAGYLRNGSTEDAACGDYNTQSVGTSGWTRVTCTFTTSSTEGTDAAAVTIYQTDDTDRTLYLDGVQLEQSTGVATAYGMGSLALDAVVTSPLQMRNIEDSAAALLVQNASGTNVFTVDTVTSTTTVGGTLSANIITPTSAFVLGATDQQFTLQGTGGSTITATDSGNTTTLGFATPTADVTLNMPALAAGTYTVCTSAGNCGGGSGTVQAAYTGSTGGSTPEVKLDATRGGFDIQDADSTTGGSLLTVRASNSGGLGSSLLDVNSTGQAFKNSTDSTAAFQVQTSSGTSLLKADTSNQRVTLGGAGIYSGTGSGARQFSLHNDTNDSTLKLSANVIGYANTGDKLGGTDSGNNNMVSASKFNSGTGGTVNSVSFYAPVVGSSPNNKIEVGIYADNSGSPGTRVGVSDLSSPTALTAASWTQVPLTMTVSLTANTTYWLAFNVNSGSTTYGGRTTGVSNSSKYYNSVSFGSAGIPSDLTSTSPNSTSTWSYAIYAPYQTIGDTAYVKPTLAVNDAGAATFRTRWPLSCV
jgi:hypothetical protein